MPILKGAVSYQRFRISAGKDLNPEQIVQKLRLFKFRPLHDHGFDQETAGWCTYLHEYDHEKELLVSDMLYDQKIILTLRHDAVALPKPLLKSLIKKSIQSYYHEHKKWPDRVVKKEIEQAEIQSLRARVLPKTRIVEAIWCQSSEELRIFSRSKALLDVFLDLFHNTFLEKPHHRDFAYEAYFIVHSLGQDAALMNPAHSPIFAPPVRIDVQ